MCVMCVSFSIISGQEWRAWPTWNSWCHRIACKQPLKRQTTNPELLFPQIYRDLPALSLDLLEVEENQE